MSALSLAGVTTYTYTTTTTPSSSGMPVALLVVYAAIAVLVIAGMWATFQKAGRHGWASIIPIYNIYTLVKIANRPGWWVLLYFIPLVNLIVHIIVSVDVANAFGKSDVFGIVALWLFAFVGYPMLGFGDAKYNGGGKSSAPKAAAA